MLDVEEQGRGGEAGKEGEEKCKQTVLPSVDSGGHCGYCWHVARRLRLSTKHSGQTEEVKE